MKLSLLTVVLLSLCMCPGLCASDSHDVLLRQGQELYQEHCTRCHGKTGEGDGLGSHYLDPKPRNFKRGIFKFGMKPDEVFQTISTGSPGTAMLAQSDKFSEEQRWALTYYVISLRESGQ